MLIIVHSDGRIRLVYSIYSRDISSFLKKNNNKTTRHLSGE